MCTEGNHGQALSSLDFTRSLLVQPSRAGIHVAGAKTSPYALIVRFQSHILPACAGAGLLCLKSLCNQTFSFNSYINAKLPGH